MAEKKRSDSMEGGKSAAPGSGGDGQVLVAAFIEAVTAEAMRAPVEGPRSVVGPASTRDGGFDGGNMADADAGGIYDGLEDDLPDFEQENDDDGVLDLDVNGDELASGAQEQTLTSASSLLAAGTTNGSGNIIDMEEEEVEGDDLVVGTVGSGAVTSDQVESANYPARGSEGAVGKDTDDDRPTRYFVIKSFSEEHIDDSEKFGMWATIPYNESTLRSAFRSAQEAGERVVLFFSVNRSGAFQGYAEMTTNIGDADTSCVDNDPNGIFSSVHGATFDRRDSLFEVEWIYRTYLPFSKTSDLHNSYNYGKPVRIARDCTEVDPDTGRGLCIAIEKVKRGRRGCASMNARDGCFDGRNALMARSMWAWIWCTVQVPPPPPSILLTRVPRHLHDARCFLRTRV